MDYQGNYFPNEQDENESKVYRTVKGIFKWTMYGISFVIYGIILFLMFINRDSKILEKNCFADLNEFKNTDPDDIELFDINTRIFMNNDGSLQVHNVDYSNEYGILEIGVKFNAKKITNGIYDDSLKFILKDSNGNNYELVNKVSDSGGRYGFERLTFKGVTLPLDSNDLRFNNALYGASKPALTVNNAEVLRDKTSFTLYVFKTANDELIHEFVIYDISVTFNHTEYND